MDARIEAAAPGGRPDLRGLTSAEAAKRRAEFGPNALAAEDEESIWEELLESLREPLQLLLLAVGVLYAVFGELRDAAIIFGVIVTVAIVETWTEWRAGRAVAALADLAAPKARAWRDGRLQDVPPTALVPGDLIALTAGSRVPADARLVEADELAADESLVTGESRPVERAAGGGERAALLAGSLVVRGRGRPWSRPPGRARHWGGSRRRWRRSGRRAPPCSARWASWPAPWSRWRWR